MTAVSIHTSCPYQLHYSAGLLLIYKNPFSFFTKSKIYLKNSLKLKKSTRVVLLKCQNMLLWVQSARPSTAHLT